MTDGVTMLGWHSATTALRGGSMTNISMRHGRTSYPDFLPLRARLYTQFQAAIFRAMAREKGYQWNSERLVGLFINYVMEILKLKYPNSRVLSFSILCTGGHNCMSFRTSTKKTISLTPARSKFNIMPATQPTDTR